MDITDNQKLLLAIGLSRGEKIGENKYKNTLLRYEDAVGLYNSKEAGQNALVTLVFKGYIENTDIPGRFRVIKATPDIEAHADKLREKRKKKEKELQEQLAIEWD